MHKYIDKIKNNQGKPFVVSNFLDPYEVRLFQKLYTELPIEINNKRQKIIKKKWSTDFYQDLQKSYNKKLKSVIGNFNMDNPKTNNDTDNTGILLTIIRNIL